MEPSAGSVKQTKDYTIFKTLAGNRKPDILHVKFIERNMVRNGNLTGNFPIVVNENMEVVDGQHRLEALKRLGWPVFYRVEPHLNIETVRAINQAGRNWSWKDYAESYAGLGKEAYKQFLELYKEYGYQFGVLMRFAMLGAGGRKKSEHLHSDTRYFSSGELVFPNLERTKKLLDQYREIVERLNFHDPKFARVMYRVLTSPQYDHERMKRKAEMWESAFTRQAGLAEYTLAIERVYNNKMAEENRVRFAY